MSDLTVAEFRQHFETDLADAAIQRVIDAVEQDVTAHAGPAGAASYVLKGGARYLYMLAPISGVTAVLERVGDTTTALDASDYRVQPGGYYIERLHQGALNPRYHWGTEVTIDVTHPAPSAKRKLVTIDIVKIELQFNGVQQENAGGYNEMMGAWQNERARLLRSLNQGLMLV